MDTIELISRGVGVLAYLAFTVFAIVNWWRSITGKALLLASATTLAWLLSSWFLALDLSRSVEALMLAAWLVLAWQALAIGNDRRSIRRSPLKQLGAFAIGTAMVTSLWFLCSFVFGFFGTQLAGEVGLLVTNVTGLMLVEQLSRNTRADLLWRVRYLSIGLSLIFVYGLVLHGTNIAFNQGFATLAVLQSAAYALATPLLVIASLRNRHNKLKFNLSRNVVFRTGVLAATGIFLLLLSLLSYLSQLFAGDTGLTVAVFLSIVLLTGFAIVVGSNEFRATLRVQLAKTFFAYRHDYRDEWLQLTRRLTETNVDFDLPQQLQRGFLNILQASDSMLFRIDGRHLVYLSRVGASNWPDQLSEKLNEEIIEFLSHQLWVLDKEAPPEDAQNLFLQLNLELPKVRFVVPLILNSELFGVCLLGESDALDHHLTWEDYDVLKLISAQGTGFLALDAAKESLVEHEKFAAVNQMSAFLIHDIKTVTAQLSLLVDNATQHSDNPEFVADMVETTRNSVQRMQKIIAGLTEQKTDTHQEPMELSSVLKNWLGMTHPARDRIKLSPGQPVRISGRKDELISAINHIVQNSLEASGPEGEVRVELSQHENWAYITITDSGPGMSAEFIENQLFKPFRTSKGVTGMGIGAYQARAMVERNGGQLRVRSEEGHGSTFTIKLPVQG